MAKDLGLDMKALEQNSRGKDRQALMREERKWIIGTCSWSENSVHYGHISKFNPMQFEKFAWPLVIGRNLAKEERIRRSSLWSSPIQQDF